MTDKKKEKYLDDFRIKEFIKYFGIKTFTDKDLEFWINQPDNYDDFMNRYFLNINNDVTYRDNVLKLYYEIDEKNEKYKLEFKDSVYGKTASDNFGTPLYDTNNNIVGVACFDCSFNLINYEMRDDLFIQEYVTYYIQKTAYPIFLDGNKEKKNLKTIHFNHSYLSKNNRTRFYKNNGIYVINGIFQNVNGLNKMNGFICIYVTGKRRNIILNFDKIPSSNFIPKTNYGNDV